MEFVIKKQFLLEVIVQFLGFVRHDAKTTWVGVDTFSIKKVFFRIDNSPDWRLIQGKEVSGQRWRIAANLIGVGAHKTSYCI